MNSLEDLLNRIKQHKHHGKKVLSIDYLIREIEKDLGKENRGYR